jgi:hypothetical protein
MGLTTHRIGADEQPTLHQAEGIDARFAVVDPVILNLTNAVPDDDSAEGEGHAMLGAVRRVFLGVVLDLHPFIYG